MDDKRVVLYTDGGCIESKCGGWGFHGYEYNGEKPKTGTGIVGWFITPTGYVSKTEDLNPKELKSIWGDMYPLHKDAGFKNVNVLNFIDGVGAIDNKSTNNIAELSALINALRFIIDRGYKKAYIIADSEYVLKGYKTWMQKWEANGWKRSDGGEVSNKVLWETLLELEKTLNENEVSLKLSWIKGHSDNLGNDKADYNCTLGVKLVERGICSLGTVDVVSHKGYFNPSVDKHPLITHPNFYFNTNVEAKIPNTYAFGNHGKKDEFVGKPVSEASFAVITTNEPIPILDIIKAKQSEVIDSGYIAFTLVKTLTIFKPYVFKEIMDNQGIFLNRKPNKPDLLDSTGLLISEVIDPPRVTWKVIELLNSMHKQLFESTRHKETVVTDITERFLDIKGKKFSIRKDFTNRVSCVIVDTESCMGNIKSKIPIHVTIGIDIPNRNAIAKLCKINPTINLLTWPVSETTLRFAIVIETDLGKGVYGGFYSNLIHLKELK